MTRNLTAYSTVMEPETIRCEHCRGLGFTTYSKREPDGNVYTLANTCPICCGAKRLLRDGTPIERRGR